LSLWKLLRKQVEKNGKSQLHLKDEALCFGFLPSVEMTIVLEKKKGSERGRLCRPRSLHTHHLIASHSDRREESLTKQLSVLKNPDRLKEETSNQAIFGFEKSRF